MSRPGCRRLVLVKPVMSKQDPEKEGEEVEETFDEGEADMEDEEFDGLLETLPAGSPLRRPGENARRRVEEYMEMKRAAKELSDLDTYDFE
jgi:hypothetical protein